jgi:hypothetical protein
MRNIYIDRVANGNIYGGLQIPFREKRQSSMHKQEFENVWLRSAIKSQGVNSLRKNSQNNSRNHT